jgi:hypothetical protein
MSQALVVSLPGYGKTESYRRLEGSVWAAVYDFFSNEILKKTAVGVVTTTAATTTVAAGGALFFNTFFGTKFDVAKAAKRGVEIGIGGGILLSATQVNWLGMIDLLADSRVIPAVRVKAREQQVLRRVEEQLMDFGCSRQASRAEFELAYTGKIAECAEQDPATAHIDELLYETSAQDIRQWYNSQNKFR